MGVAAVMGELANARLLKFDTNFSPVVAEQCPNVVLTRKVLR
jgi:hypothetical protein